MTQGSNLTTANKAGSSITLGNVSILFRLGKDLKPREKFKSTQTFDEQLAAFKDLFGFIQLKSSIIELSNQSLSRLAYYFSHLDSQQTAVKATEVEAPLTVVKPEKAPVEQKATWVMSYLDHSDWGSLFPESLFVHQQMLKLFFKFIPEYITNLGMKLLYSKVRDGTSYQR